MAFLRLSILALIVFSCSESSPRPNSRADLFSGEDAFGKTWQVERIELELGTLQPKTCVTDNFITYFPDGTYELNEGATKCDPADLPGIIGTWSLNSAEDKLYVRIGDSTQVWDIDETKTDSHRITSTFKEGKRTYSFILSN